MDTNTQITLNKYFKFKGLKTRWVSDEEKYKFRYNLNIHEEDEESGLNLNPKNFRQIADQLMQAFDGKMHLNDKGFLLSLHTSTDNDGYVTTYLYYNPESNGVTLDD